MNKQKAYEKLVEEYLACDMCEAGKPCEKLHKDVPKLKKIAECKKTKHLNLWNYWQGSLDAKIMVIGQDWGNTDNVCESKQKDGCQDSYECIENIHSRKNMTCVNLIKYLALALDIQQSELDVSREDLYFTNSALCYRRSKKISGNDQKKWFAECNRKFMGKLIEIINPKIIIVLGKRAFDGLKECGDIISVNGKPIPTRFQDKKIKDGEKGELGIISYGRCILKTKCHTYDLFPVCHTGSNSNMNRGKEKQKADWKKIGKYISNLIADGKW